MYQSKDLLVIMLGVLVILFMSACEEDMSEYGENQQGEATIALTEVPAEVLCIRITASGESSIITQDYDVATGEDTTSLEMGRLPLGLTTFEGWAYDVACESLSDPQITYIADPVDAELRVGVVEDIYLTFREKNPVDVTADFLKSVKKVVTGGPTTILLFEDGTLRFFGGMDYSNNLDLTNIVDVDVDFSNVCVIQNGGSLWCWGNNTYGQVGDGTNTYRRDPVEIAPGQRFESVTMGMFHTCATTTSNSVYCWGRNNRGQLGIGSTDDTNVPTRIQLSRYYDHVYAGDNHTCAKSGYAVYCWGYNRYGQIGNGTITNAISPTRVSPLGAVTDMVLGSYHTCAILADSTIQCWGMNVYGQFGNDSTASAQTPQSIPDISEATHISAGYQHTCARFEDTTVSCWGGNYTGQLGNKSNERSLVPIEILSGAESVHVGYTHGCARMEDQTVKCWGENYQKQLGDGTRETRWEPTDIVSW